METENVNIKRYVLEDSYPDQDFDEKMALIYKDKDYLINRGLWNDDIRKKVASYNTLHNFTYMRKLQIKDNLLAYSSLYLASKYSLNFFNSTECDVLTLQDYFLSKGSEYVKLKIWDIIEFLQINRKPTKEFVRFLYQEDALGESFKNDPMYFSMLVEIEDIKSLIERYKNMEMDVDTKFKFINRIDYKEWKKYVSLFDEEFLIKYLGCFRYYDLLLFIRDKKKLHEIISKATYQERFKMYEKLDKNQKIIDETRKELKSLVKSNLEKKIQRFKLLSNQCPNSVIEEVISQIASYSSLIPLVAEIIKAMSSSVKDVFVFYILRFIKSQMSFVNGDHFSKWFINICSLIKSIKKDIFIVPVLDLIRDLLREKRYSCVLLLESVELPDDIRNDCKKIYRKVFIYEDYSLKLKMDVSDKYSVLIERKFKLKPSTANLKFMTLFEIDSIGIESLDWVVKLIKDTNNLEDDYFAVRNLAMIVRNFIDSLKEYHSKIKNIFKKFENDDEEDIRVLCCSLIGKIMTYEKIKANINKRQDDTTISEPKRMKIEEKNNKNFEIATNQQPNKIIATNQQPNKIIATNQQPNKIIATNQQPNKIIATNQQPNKVVVNQNSGNTRPFFPPVFDRNLKKILNLEDYLRHQTHNYKDSFIRLIRMPSLPVFDVQGRPIKHLEFYLYGKQGYM